MTTFLVHMPAEDLPRLSMFNRNAVQQVPVPQLVSLRRDQTVAMIRASFSTIGRMAKMFPNWRFQALLGEL